MQRRPRFLCPLFAAVLASAQVASVATRPIPDPAALLKEVKANQQKMDAVRENFTFHLFRQTADLDKNGVTVKTTSIEREVFFVNGRRIGRLVKQDGQPLSPSEDKAEQARVKKAVDTAIKEGPPAHSQNRLGEISQILAMVKISNPRRISFNGRPTLAYDFTGDPNAHSHGMEQGAAKKVSGTLCFDEAEHQLARLEVRFEDTFHIGGGLLAAVQRGTTMEFEQAPVGDGLWMQTSSAQHLDARLVIKKFRQDVHTRAFDFKKFNTEVLQQIAPPAVP